MKPKTRPSSKSPLTTQVLRSRRGIALLSILALVACSEEPPSESSIRAEPAPPAPLRLLDLPAGPGSMAPQLAPSRDGILLSWLESVDPGDRSRGFKLQLAELSQEEWTTPPLELVAGDAFFANWADLPAVVEGTTGTRFAHWLHKLGEDTFAYGAELLRSADGAESWEELGLLHDDAAPTEHGFVSYVALADGTVQAFWLDGRDMPSGGPMQLRTARLGDTGPPGASTLLDDRVCECCATDAALSSAGPVVVYRNRSASEVRDVYVVRASGDGWSEPSILHDDGWQIHGCPVNGPAIAADGPRAAVAWFTASEPGARVTVAFSDNAGASFEAPIVVDGQEPLGRVDVALDSGGHALVSWMGRAGEEAEIRWRRVTRDGELGEVRVVAGSTGLRSAGVPRMLLRGRDLVFAWVEDAEPSRVRAGLVSLSP